MNVTQSVNDILIKRGTHGKCKYCNSVYVLKSYIEDMNKKGIKHSWRNIDKCIDEKGYCSVCSSGSLLNE
jgi:hypothetical protein